MAFLKRKTFFALLFVFLVLLVLGSWYLPKLVFDTFASKKELKVELIDYHNSLDFSFGDRQKIDQLAGMFSDIIVNQKIKRLNIILTDVEQAQKINWMNSKYQLVNHLGFDVQVGEKTMDIYLYNNFNALSESGWDSIKIQREDELLLVRALLFERGIRGEKLESQIKETYLALQNLYKEPLFNIAYAL